MLLPKERLAHASSGARAERLPNGLPNRQTPRQTPRQTQGVT